MPNQNSENKITFAMDLALIGRLQIIYQIETNKVIKERYLIRQDNTIIVFDIFIFFKYRIREIKATETNM